VRLAKEVLDGSAVRGDAGLGHRLDLRPQEHQEDKLGGGVAVHDVANAAQAVLNLLLVQPALQLGQPALALALQRHGVARVVAAQHPVGSTRVLTHLLDGLPRPVLGKLDLAHSCGRRGRRRKPETQEKPNQPLCA
jgi:hypothetical protein